MNFKIVGDDNELYISNEEGLTICKLMFFEGGKAHQAELKQWMDKNYYLTQPAERRLMIKELVHTIECLTNRYTQIYPDHNQMPWYWVRAEQAIQKAREWLVVQDEMEIVSITHPCPVDEIPY